MSFETDKWTWILFTNSRCQCSTKQEFLKILQISQENTWAKFSFLWVSKIFNDNHFFFTFRGFAKLTDESGSREIFYLAPSIFLGNKRSSYMYYLSFDLSQETINNPMDASHEGDVIVKGRLQNFRLVYKLTIMPAKYQKFQSYQVSSFFFLGPALEWRYIFHVTLSCYKKCDESFFGVEILSGKAF